MRSFVAIGLLWACAAANAGGVRDPVQPRAAADGGHEGAIVLWGGRIVAHTVVDNQLCVEVGSRVLARDGKPSGYLYDAGQIFLACDASGGVLDLRVGSTATFAGELDRVAVEERKPNCMADPYGNWPEYMHSRNERMDGGGCRLWMPVLAVSDTKSWREPPTSWLPPPTPMSSR